MATKIQLRRDTAANWTSNDPTLATGEAGYETDTGKLKLGDGTTAWTSLSYYTTVPGSHSLGGSEHSTDTLANLNSKISDATLIDTGDSRLSDARAPTAHTHGTADIDNDAVTYAKIQNVSATDRILGRDTAGAGDVEEITPAALRTMINVEDGATADQSDGEIKTAYENNANTNAFTDAEQSKLSAIEASADVTDATNVDAAGAAMNSDTTTAAMNFVIDEDNMASNLATKVPTQQSVKAYVDTTVTSAKSYIGGYNAATNTPDLDTTPIAGIEIGDQYTVTAAGTFFTTAVEIGDVLISEKNSPTLEADWTIVQSNLDAASIKTQYESNADTNEFSDAEQTKLAGIETGATADQTNAEIKTAYEANADTNEFSDAEQTKLAGIATAATANDTDANLKARANHTGTQLASTISDFDSTVTSSTHAGRTDDPHNVTKAQVGLTNVPDLKQKLDATVAPGATDDSAAGYAVGSKWVDVTGDKVYFCVDSTATSAVWKEVSPDHSHSNQGVLDATTASFLTADETKLDGIATAATANDTDANLKARANHTGTQTASTISDFEAAVAAGASTTANTAKVTNATHTGEVTGSGALVLDKTAITGKTLVTGVGTDHMLIADASDTGNLKKVLLSDVLGGGADAAAIHDDTAAEISAIAEKTTPVSADLLLIEDSAASNAKKRVQIGNLPGSDTVAYLLNFGDKTGPGIATTSTSYLNQGMFVYCGITALSGKCAALVSSGATGQIRYYNVTQAEVVFESTTFSNTTYASIDLGTLVNQPVDNDIIELQIKRATGAGGDQVTIASGTLFSTI